MFTSSAVHIHVSIDHRDIDKGHKSIGNSTCPTLVCKVRKSENFPDFCRNNSLDKTRTSRPLSNLQQIRVKSEFANFKHKHGSYMLHRVHL